ncbi:hypothetical protein [Paenibacillus sp. DMB5]|uniref:hypothetical protein n=1 Tax=Paenibacillus sp. DMB5 TaxID=1780103 RepID=UPI00076C96D5|nr:hypothetical protein [Paenibacillus sp. DMB5]KUP21751.1 hypothetical protein AWJ19_02050 [Paenibacillus sp. DMB5]
MLNPVAFSIGPVPVHWYGIIIGVGTVEGVRTDSLSFAGPDWLAALLKAAWSPAAFLGWGTMQAEENIRTSQLLAVLILLAAAAVIIVRRIRKTAVPYSSDIEWNKYTEGITK